MWKLRIFSKPLEASKYTLEIMSIPPFSDIIFFLQEIRVAERNRIESKKKFLIISDIKKAVKPVSTALLLGFSEWLVKFLLIYFAPLRCFFPGCYLLPDL